ncbi:MAG: PAS domain-containing sensor histidine kinase [Bacteroidaceae bacterium]|nr:PAS domain-containing sensor histidine kinase [Bacteroidaceae bacterium]
MKTYLFYIIGILGLIICLALSIQAHLLWPSIALGVMLIWLFVSLYGRISRLRYAYHETEKENQKLHVKLAEAERQLQYLRQLTENVDTALFVCDTEGRIDWMNHAAEKTLSPTLPLYGEGVLPENILRAIDEGTEVVDGCALSTVLLRIDGKRRFVVALKDVSMLMQRQEMEAWQQLIRVLTHEIMNSLTPIISISETLAGSFPQGGGQEGAAVINRRCHSLLDFVESYRQLTRIKTPEKTTFPVSELFEHLKALFSLTPSPSPGRGEKNTPQLTFSPLPGEGLEVRLLADRAQIEQVLINLIKNAYESGATQVEISAESLPSIEGGAGRGSAIRIRDNGCGMPADVLEHAFIPFYTTKTTGTGIGLSLCRQIILKHGGTIHIESEEKKGTTIEIKI